MKMEVSLRLIRRYFSSNTEIMESQEATSLKQPDSSVQTVVTTDDTSKAGGEASIDSSSANAASSQHNSFKPRHIDVDVIWNQIRDVVDCVMNDQTCHHLKWNGAFL